MFNNIDMTQRNFLYRFIVYSMVIIIAYLLFCFIGRRMLMTNTADCIEESIRDKNKHKSALELVKGIDVCLQARNSFLENFMMRKIHGSVRSLPNAPREYVGFWYAYRPGCSHDITLNADGTFYAKPIACGKDAEISSGIWGVSENNFVWIYTRGLILWPPDINVIKSNNSNEFHLEEETGLLTIFTRIMEK